MKNTSSYRWFVLGVFFFFILLHQADKLLIGPLTSPIMETFNIGESAMGAVFSGALLVGAILYPIWGYLYDRFVRARLLAVASLIWGLTTWLSAVAPSFPAFFASRASTGIDDSSYPGLYSLIADYFGPEMRGKIFGFLQLAQPLGYLIGLVVATLLVGDLGWRRIFLVTGGLGIVLAGVIFFAIREVPRGQAEPELAQLEFMHTYRFNRQHALGLFRKPSLLLLFAQGFVGVFPWNVITFWIFRYLEVERGYDQNEVLLVMGPAVLILAAGYFIGGALGDRFFARTPRGRMLVALSGVILGAIFLGLTFSVPLDNPAQFRVLMFITALFIPFASPNVLSSVNDITLPEVRSSALSIQYFIENGGAALAPLLAGIIAERYSLQAAILWICISAWILTAIFLALTAFYIPRDYATLRQQLDQRARLERRSQPDAGV
jgi:MFS family permease